jgi:hypothetical protein
MLLRVTRAQKYASSALAACAVWIVISAIFVLPPAGMIYRGQSLVSCTGVLREISTMKDLYAYDKGLQNGDSIDPADLHNHFGGRIPKCPGGGTYTYNKIGTPPVCSFAGTRGLKPQKELIGYFWWRWKIPPSGRHELFEMPLPGGQSVSNGASTPYE